MRKDAPDDTAWSAGQSFVCGASLVLTAVLAATQIHWVRAEG